MRNTLTLHTGRSDIMSIANASLIWAIIIAVVGGALWLGQEQGRLTSQAYALEGRVIILEDRRDALVKVQADVEHIKRQLDLIMEEMRKVK